MIVLDASFLVKLVLEEEGSGEARGLAAQWARSMERLSAPDLALSEALNAIWKHATKIGDLSVDEAQSAAGDLIRIWRFLDTYPTSRVAMRALAVALRENVTVYDGIYLALALELGAGLASFDDKLRTAAIRLGLSVYPQGG